MANEGSPGASVSGGGGSLPLPSAPAPDPPGPPTGIQQKLFLPGSTYRQTFWDPRTARARVVGWATGISATDPSPRRSVVDKYFADHGYFFPEVADDQMVLDSIDVEMKGPTKAKFAANYKIQSFRINAGDANSVPYDVVSLRPSTIGVPVYKSIKQADPNDAPLDNNGLPTGEILSADVCKIRPAQQIMSRATMEMTITVVLANNPLVFLAPLVGKLNKNSVTIISVTFNPGSIMYLGQSMEVYSNRFGTSYVVTYTFNLDTYLHKQHAIEFAAGPESCGTEGNDDQWIVKTVDMGQKILGFSFPG